MVVFLNLSELKTGPMWNLNWSTTPSQNIYLEIPSEKNSKNWFLCIILGVFISLVFTLLGNAFADEPQCLLKNVLPINDKSVAYIPRSTRCEGLFVKKVSNTDSLDLLGFHLHKPVIKYRHPNDTNWVALGELTDQKSVVLRAVSLRRKHFYQMDTNYFAKDGVFKWKADVLSQRSIRLNGKELGFLACIANCEYGEDKMPVLRAVSVLPEGKIPNKIAPYLVIKPPPKTKEIFVTLFIDEKMTDTFRFNHEKVGLGPYDDDYPVRFFLGGNVFQERKVLYLNLEAERRDGRYEEYEAILTLGLKSDNE